MDNTDTYYNAVDTAKAAYDALTQEEKDLLGDAIDFNYIKKLEDNIAAEEVIKLIEEIGDVTYNGGTDDSLVDIVAAENAYNALTDDQKALVEECNYNDLTYDRKVYDSVEETVNLIATIGGVEYTDESKDKIAAARRAYDALSEVEKALINGYNDSYKTLDDDEHVYTVLEYINNIGDVSYNTDSEEKIKEAREYYESLTPAQKELVKMQDLEVLTTSEEEYGTLEKNANILVVILLIITCLTIVGGGIWLFFILKDRNDDDDNDDSDGNKKGFKLFKSHKKSVKVASFTGLMPLIYATSHYIDAPWIALYILATIALLIIICDVILFFYFRKKKAQRTLANKDDYKEESTPLTINENPSNEDEEEVITITDEKGNIFNIRYIKSFTAKLIQSPEETKKYYEELKNYVLSYKKTTSRVSWHYDSINSGRNQVLKFAIRGKTLCVYYPLNAEDYNDTKYKVEAVESKKYEEVPCLYRIKNDRRLGYAKELIDLLMNQKGISKGNELNDDYRIPYEETKVLLAKGLIKEVKTIVKETSSTNRAISVFEADASMSDEVAEENVKYDITSKKHHGKKDIINIDTIGQNFNDNDVVDIEALWEKKLISTNVGYVKVLARGSLNKKLNVHLQEYSIQAVKMILLEGGTVRKAR